VPHLSSTSHSEFLNGHGGESANMDHSESDKAKKRRRFKEGLNAILKRLAKNELAEDLFSFAADSDSADCNAGESLIEIVYLNW